jgi:hypothetical protein
MKTTPTTWPDGTPRSQGNAFTAWRTNGQLGLDSIVAQDHTCCSSLYNCWRADQRAGNGRGSRMTWPQYRDTQKPRAKDFAHREIGGQVNGFGANGGTIVGLSPKADKMLAQQGKLLPLEASVWNTGSKAVKTPHTGAYSKASRTANHGKPAHLARKPDQPKARKASV